MQQENSATFDLLTQKLEAGKVAYSCKSHAAVATSQQSADVRGSRLEEGAKAMLVCSKGSFYLIVLSATHKINWRKLKKALAVKDVSLASTEEVMKVTGCVTGAVPPFGSLWSIPTYMDASLKRVAEIEFNAGLRTCSIRMNLQDFERVEAPTQIDVAEPLK